MTREEYIDFANALKNNYTIDFDKLPEFCDMAISALSENKTPSGEYISKADMERILYSTNNAVRIGESFMELPTYSIPGTAAPGEYIKKADAIRIASITTLSVDQVVSTIKALSTYSFPDSAEDNTMEWIFKPNIYGVDYCSKCGYENWVNDTKFCPNCGRKAVSE